MGEAIQSGGEALQREADAREAANGFSEELTNSGVQNTVKQSPFSGDYFVMIDGFEPSAFVRFTIGNNPELPEKGFARKIATVLQDQTATAEDLATIGVGVNKRAKRLTLS